MPYYTKKQPNDSSYAPDTILFIHIPKTGGTSLEGFLRSTNIYTETLFSKKETRELRTIIPDNKLNQTHLQHHSLRTLSKYQSQLNICLKKTSMFLSIVRNPYDRIISELFWRRLVVHKDSPNDVFIKLYKLLHDKSAWSNEHLYPQTKFLINEENVIDTRFTILKTENLCSQIQSLGGIFTGFDFFRNTNNSIDEKESMNTSSLKYNKWLNTNSIQMINDFFNADFKNFNYKIL